MITKLWQTYADGEHLECLRAAAEELIQHSGIDLLAAAGLSLIRLRRVNEGLVMLKAAATFRPDSITLYHTACAITQEFCLAEDLESFAKLGLDDFPNDITLQRYLGNAYLLTMNYTKALSYYQTLLQTNPNDLLAHINLASTYRALEQFDLAERHYAFASLIDPNHRDIAIGQATIHLAAGRWADARALLLPIIDDPDAKMMLAHDALAHGDYPTGWRLHADRWDSVTMKVITKPPRPFHTLAEIRGQRVAVMREGGHGDVFQFFRYVPLLASVASEVLLYCSGNEYRLLQCNLPPNVSLRCTLALPDGYDYTTSIFDLPYHFNTTVETIPPAPYLFVPEPILRQQCLLLSAKKRVGIVWAGGQQTSINSRPYDARRSIRLDQLAGFIQLTNEIEFISLQAGPRAKESGLPMTEVLTDDGDWLDTAAIIRQLDLVITVDTAVVHLAGALGCPTWLLSRIDPCWRWLHNRTNSPWYQDIVRVFGQTVYDDWRPTILTVRQELDRWLGDFD